MQRVVSMGGMACLAKHKWQGGIDQEVQGGALSHARSMLAPLCREMVGQNTAAIWN